MRVGALDTTYRLTVCLQHCVVGKGINRFKTDVVENNRMYRNIAIAKGKRLSFLNFVSCKR